MNMKTTIKEIKKNLTQIVFTEKKSKKTLYLVGTAHVSKASVELVKETINEYKPNAVFVELDETRKENMLNKKYLEIDIIQIIKKKKSFFT